MKAVFYITLLFLSPACNSVSRTELPGAIAADVQQGAEEDRVSDGQTITLSEQGISFRLPKDWRDDGDPLFTDHSWFQRWYGVDKIILTLYFSDYKPEFIQDSMAESIKNFYEEKKRSDAKEVRFLEINGVRGVHYLSVLQEVQRQAVKWQAQFIYKGKRRLLEMSILCPDANFMNHKDELYGVLHSIQFLRDETPQ